MIGPFPVLKIITPGITSTDLYDGWSWRKKSLVNFYTSPAIEKQQRQDYIVTTERRWKVNEKVIGPGRERERDVVIGMKREKEREKGKVLGFLTEIFRDKTRNNTPERQQIRNTPPSPSFSSLSSYPIGRETVCIFQITIFNVQVYTYSLNRVLLSSN